jgi:hypothetical protein
MFPLPNLVDNCSFHSWRQHHNSTTLSKCNWPIIFACYYPLMVATFSPSNTSIYSTIVSRPFAFHSTTFTKVFISIMASLCISFYCFMISRITIWWVCECEQVSRIDFFGNILLTHGIKHFVMWRNILPCIHGWEIFMDEKWKQMNKIKMKETYSQPRVMCQSKLCMFTTKKYVSIETPLVHL